MLKVIGAMYLKNGGETKAYPAIEPTDMRKVAQYFDRSTPEILQEEIIFNTIYYFGMRGRETLRQLTQDSFRFKTDANGRACVEIATGLATKNNVVSTNLVRSTYENSKQCCMYATPDKPSRCPVTALRMYIGKLPKNHKKENCFFPFALDRFSEQLWYSDKRSRGENWLGDTMKRISEKLEVSKETLECPKNESYLD